MLNQTQKTILYSTASLAFLIHLFANPHYGFVRDELYFIMCGLRPQWGYLDQPPLVPLLAAGSQLFGHSLFLLRMIPALISGLSIYVTGLLTIELGGGIFAQIFAALVAFFCPVLASFATKLSTDSLGLFLWPLIILWTLRIVKNTHSPRLWIWIGIGFGVSFLAKYSVLFFTSALLISLLTSHHWRKLFLLECYVGLFVGCLIVLPNVLWQAHFDFPILELLKMGQIHKNIILSPFEFLYSQILITNPFLAFTWLLGLFWLLRNPQIRFLGILYFILMLEMLITHGKHYYAANIYPVLIGAGSIFVEEISIAWNHHRIMRFSLIGFVFFAGLSLIPYALPILPLPLFIHYHQTFGPLLHMSTINTEKAPEGILPRDWADTQGWPELTQLVSQVYASLSPQDQKSAVILTRNYGQAAALEFFGQPYGLPPVISGHNQYHLWGTQEATGEVIIELGGDCEKKAHLYQSSILAATFSHPYVTLRENQLPIHICRGMTHPLAEIWPQFKSYN